MKDSGFYVTVDGKKAKARSGESVLELLRRLGKDVPYLCYDRELRRASASCRLCIVEIDSRVMTSCNTKAARGMDIRSTSRRLEKMRRTNLKLIVESNDPKDYESEKMKELIRRYKIKRGFDLGLARKKRLIRNVGLEIDERKCILCDNCEEVCDNMQVVNAFDMSYDGIKTKLIYDGNVCTYCGQCILHCPTGAIMEHDETEKFLNARKIRKGPASRGGRGRNIKLLIAQVAPSVRASIGEEFGYKPGTNVEGKLVAALHRLGFDKVFDVNLGADMTAAEEGNEFLERLKMKAGLPLFTSCCPSWVKYVEEYYPEFRVNLSSCKSPHMMLGKMIKTYYAEKAGVEPHEIFLVSIMPCVSKKFEISRPEFGGVDEKYRDVDLVLTTRETAKLIKRERIEFRRLNSRRFDRPLGKSSGGGSIFGASGGVMESSLRVVFKELRRKRILFKKVRGYDGVKSAELELGGKKIRVAVVQKLRDAREILEDLREQRKRKAKGNKKRLEYHFIEVMACPGGCIGGGGQPLPSPHEVVERRGNALYRIDTGKKVRVATDNLALKKIYKEFLGQPLGRMSEKLLHTDYFKRKISEHKKEAMEKRREMEKEMETVEEKK